MRSGGLRGMSRSFMAVLMTGRSRLSMPNKQSDDAHPPRALGVLDMALLLLLMLAAERTESVCLRDLSGPLRPTFSRHCASGALPHSGYTSYCRAALNARRPSVLGGWAGRHQSLTKTLELVVRVAMQLSFSLMLTACASPRGSHRARCFFRIWFTRRCSLALAPLSMFGV